MTDVNFYKTKQLKIFDYILFNKVKVVLRITDKGLFYNSTLGDLGLIPAENIKFIEKGIYENLDVINIGINDTTKIKCKMSGFGKALFKLYKEKTDVEILILPNEVDVNLEELYKSLKEIR